MCKIRSGTTELSKPVNITVEVHEGKVEGRYAIDGKAEMPGFTFVVIVQLYRYCNMMLRKTLVFFFSFFFVFKS